MRYDKFATVRVAVVAFLVCGITMVSYSGMTDMVRKTVALRLRKKSPFKEIVSPYDQPGSGSSTGSGGSSTGSGSSSTSK